MNVSHVDTNTNTDMKAATTGTPHLPARNVAQQMRNDFFHHFPLAAFNLSAVVKHVAELVIQVPADADRPGLAAGVGAEHGNRKQNN
jgi:hypothetical protein